jgi:putative membrane protein
MDRRLPLVATCATLAFAAPAGAANSVPRWDRHFLLDTAEGAHFEIDMGKIAERRATTDEARRVGRLMVKDHSGELHAVEALANSLGVKLPEHPSAVERHNIAGVTRHHGMAFDRADARLEVADHIMDLQSADGEIMEGGLDSVKAFAQKYRLV